jgi:alpha-tubulin suppressor-like RCC1 family protein
MTFNLFFPATLAQLLCGQTPKLYIVGYGIDAALSTKTIGETYITNIPGNVVQVASGTDFFVIRNDLGSLYSWGANNFGQLGVDNTSLASVYVPTAINVSVTTSLITRVRCGQSTCLAYTQANELIGWGYNSYGM